jgi:hypothetical protein
MFCCPLGNRLAASQQCCQHPHTRRAPHPRLACHNSLISLVVVLGVAGCQPG